MQDADMQRNIQHNEFGSSVNPHFLIRHVDFTRTALKVQENLFVGETTVIHVGEDVYRCVHRMPSLVMTTAGKSGGENSIYIYMTMQGKRQ